jgi:hypothetical protein
MIYEIDGWEDIEDEQQGDWLQNPEKIPENAFTQLSLSGAARLHLLLFGHTVTLRGVSSENEARDMLIKAVKTGKPLTDRAFYKDAPKDALI